MCVGISVIFIDGFDEILYQGYFDKPEKG